MSYNTRRGSPAQSNIANIGARRPVASNFTPALSPQKSGTQPPQQGFSTQQANRTQQPQPNQQKIQQPQAVPPAPTPVEVKNENGTEGEKKKWITRKIPRKEVIRRRNQRLSKLLQPKNALMVLNELMPSLTYNVVDSPTIEGMQYKAVVTIEGQEHQGFGKTKNNARCVAAETALKHIIKNKKLSQLPKAGTDESEEMETSETEKVEDILPWQQVASFALFKLFNSWDEGLFFFKDEQPVIKKKKPAKKMPENPETLNPLMVLNQMLPNAVFEEEIIKGDGGSPSTTVFNMKCTVDGKVFTGSGNTKKLAKKQAAFAVCNVVLGIQYPAEVYTPK